MTMIDLNQSMTQAEFGDLVGMSQQAVSEALASMGIGLGMPVGEQLLAYCRRLREVAAGRGSAEAGGLDLVQERAALARSQRIAQDMKNAVAACEYMPVGVLADVLATASSAVRDRFDQLEGMLQKACPELPDEAKATIMHVIANARNEWVRSTVDLVSARLDESATDEDGDDRFDVEGEG